MQMLLSQMVLELRYHARGIQVKTPEKKASTTVRTNDSENYDIDLEIECNEDEQEARPTAALSRNCSPYAARINGSRWRRC